MASMERRRALAASPVPMKKTGSCGLLLERILSRPTIDLSAANGFGLAQSYHSDPKYKPRNLARFGASLPNSPRSPFGRAGSPLAGAFKAMSAPIAPRHARVEGGGGEGEGEGAEVEGAEAEWACRACGNRDASQLQRSSDSFMVCECGAVDSMHLVSQTRSKNCPKGEDKTDVADAPVADAQSAALAACAKGSESASERTQRLLASAGGTRSLSRSAVKKHDVATAQNNLNRCTAREARLRIEGNSREATKLRAVLKMVEHVFDQLPGLDERIRGYIRLEAKRVFEAGLEHEKACGGRDCLLSLSARSSMLVATGAVELGLGQLCGGERPDCADEALARVAPEVTQQELRAFVARARTLELQNSSPNQRLQVLSALRIVACWKPGECTRPCAPSAPPPPPLLRLPPSLFGNQDYGSGKCRHADPADAGLCRLQQSIISVARIAPPLPAKVRNAALEALLFKSVKTFLASETTQQLPVDVIAIGLTVASARKLKCEDPPPPWHKELYKQHGLTTWTVDEFTNELATLLKPLPAVKDEGDIW